MSESPANARPIQVVKAAEVNETGTGQTDGMIRQTAIVDKSPQLCSLLMRASPHTSSGVHHHGSQDTIIHAISGRATVISLDESSNQKKMILEPGDWALIPAFRVHQEVNESDEECVLAIVRAPGGFPETVNLKGWSGEEES